jgi:hypothetical protein
MKNCFTQKNIVFQVAVHQEAYVGHPDTSGDWEGEEYAETTSYAKLDLEQFLGLVVELCLYEDSCPTAGMEVERGYIVPAVDLIGSDYNGNRRTSYVSVYTEKILKSVIEEAGKPQPMPVLQDDFTVKPQNLSFGHSDIMQAAVNVLPEVIKQLGLESQYGQVDEALNKKFIRLLNAGIRKEHNNIKEPQ